ncbi:MAG: hypothetical protein HQL87_00195 [Magnetococcales bacterium]|nr:hypothetical protein [Magnetococcales bacterium]
MERRHFFRLGLQKALQTVVNGVESGVEQRSAGWFRPPYAQREMAFLLSCTRCDRCIQACPHGVLFALPLRVGVRAAATPAMDLLTHGCHLCSDWPCVQVCEPSALQRPAVETGAGPPLPRLAQVTIDPGLCLPYQGPECGACGSVCPIPGAIHWAGPRPTIVASLCIGCALCREACVTTPKAVKVQTLRREPEADSPPPA